MSGGERVFRESALVTVHSLAMLKFRGEVTYVFGSWFE